MEKLFSVLLGTGVDGDGAGDGDGGSRVGTDGTVTGGDARVTFRTART
jgi:hypothetical protein